MVDTQHETPEPQPEPEPVPVQPEPAPWVDDATPSVAPAVRVRRRPSRAELLVGGGLLAAGLVIGSGLTFAFTGDDDHGPRFGPGMQQFHEGFGPDVEGRFDDRFGGPGGLGGRR